MQFQYIIIGKQGDLKIRVKGFVSFEAAWLYIHEHKWNGFCDVIVKPRKGKI